MLLPYMLVFSEYIKNVLVTWTAYVLYIPGLFLATFHTMLLVLCARDLDQRQVIMSLVAWVKLDFRTMSLMLPFTCLSQSDSNA